MGSMLINWPILTKDDDRPHNMEAMSVFELGDTNADVGIIRKIGRSDNNDFQIDDNHISRNHVRLFNTHEGWFVEDLNSTNGTKVNGERFVDIAESLGPLHNGDLIQLGESQALMFQDSSVNIRDFQDIYVDRYETPLSLDLSGLSLISLVPMNILAEGAIYVSPEVIRHGHLFMLQADIDNFIESAPVGYSVTGWWGHGINSYAFYFVRITDREKLFFRLPYGGAFMDSKETAQDIVTFMKDYSELHELAASIDVRLQLVSSMDPGLEYDITGESGEARGTIHRELGGHFLGRLSDICKAIA